MKETGKSVKGLTAQAAEAEKNKDAATAIELYREIIAKDALNMHSYDRLMKLYRQLKEYKKELAIINRGIKAYETFYNKHTKKPSQKVSELSMKLNKSFGLIDKKGNPTYNPEPLGRWQKRKLIVDKKLKS